MAKPFPPNIQIVDILVNRHGNFSALWRPVWLLRFDNLIGFLDYHACRQVTLRRKQKRV